MAWKYTDIMFLQIIFWPSFVVVSKLCFQKISIFSWQYAGEKCLLILHILLLNFNCLDFYLEHIWVVIFIVEHNGSLVLKLQHVYHIFFCRLLLLFRLAFRAAFQVFCWNFLIWRLCLVIITTNLQSNGEPPI